MAHQHHIVVRVGGKLRIQLLDQYTLAAIVNPRTVLREQNIPEVGGLRCKVHRDVGGSASRSALAVGNRGSDSHLLGLWTAAVGAERHRAGIELGHWTGAGDGAFRSSPT